MGMNLTTDMSILTLITDASWVVKGVIGLLLLASIVSWALIFQKVLLFRRERNTAERFEQEFWGEGRAAILKREQENKTACCSMESVFQSGYYAFKGMRRQTGATPENMVESARRAMRAAYQREMDALESHLSFLATIGSVSPYVGLFGTVWGIMNAFRGLSNVAQATLAHVAPGIAEALVATAIGLFAAIPAVIAYNHFTHELDRLANRFDVFMEELSNILQRESHRPL
jgi:biopolymer transport protein TolQ